MIGEKMKIILSICALVFFSGVSFASETFVEPQTSLVQSGETISQETQGLSNSASRASACAADTYCADGRYLGCTASGIVTRCERSSGNWISCRAWGSNGSYSQAVDRCY